VPANYKYARILASSRRSSEDRAVVFEHGDSLVVVVADGAGGMGGGAAAADTLVLWVRTALADNAFDIGDGASRTTLFSDIDGMLAEKMNGETTGVLVVVSPRGVLGVSAGDSPAVSAAYPQPLVTAARGA
jgi:serine/threonine protein phosphatase PrpC